MKKRTLNVIHLAVLFVAVETIITHQLLCKTKVYVSNSTPFTFNLGTEKVTILEGTWPDLDKEWQNIKHNKKILPWHKKVLMTDFEPKKSNKRIKETHELPLTSKELPNLILTPIIDNVSQKLMWTIKFNKEKLPMFDSDNKAIKNWESGRYSFTKAPKTPSHYIKDKSNKKYPLLVRIYKRKKDELEYVISSCHQPTKYTTPSTADPKSINILAWNLYLMTKESMRIPKGPWGGAADKPGVQERAMRIPDAIGNKYDILMLCEAWDIPARVTLLKKFKSLGYNYATCILGSGYMLHQKKGIVLEQPAIINFHDKKFGTDQQYTQAYDGRHSEAHALFSGGKAAGNGGVIIVSKWPIIKTKAKELIYTAATGDEAHVKKGCVYACIEKKGQKYHLFSTHTGNPNDRPSQFKEIRWFIDQLKIPANEPVIIAGDMNVNQFSNELKTMLTFLNSKMLPLRGDITRSADYFTNYFKHCIEHPEMLDYVLIDKKHLQPLPSKSFVEIRHPVSTIWEIKGPHADNPEYIRKGDWPYTLSDHEAVFAHLEF